MKRRLAAVICAGLLLFGMCLEGAGGFSARAEAPVIIVETLPDELITEAEDGTPEREALVEGYIEKILSAARKTTVSRGTALMGSSLTGVNWTLYAALSEKIAQVAAGTLTSTVFSFPAEDVYDQLTFTAEDLGVDDILEDRQFTDEAREAIRREIISFDGTKILRALMADCPYELYWYNKATGGGCRISYPSVSTDGVTVTMIGRVTFSMTVAREYAVDTYETDPAVGQTVSAAVENARGIAEQFRELDDYARLKAYKDAICDLTVYNSDAANDGDMPYGNPWQLIWVFDGDPETNVLCEGYAKAFQFLNELSMRGVTVISPSGTMNGESHMWNVVTMEDGKNYLVDVTNCDTGMAGAPDRLFLAGCISGSVAEGYVVSVGDRLLRYAYSDGLYSESQRALAGWRYLDGQPPTPALETAAEETLYEHQPVQFAYQDAGYEYDAVMAQITYRPEDGEEEETALETVEIGPDGSWSLLPGDYGPGTFSVCFAGVRDGVTSAWTEPAAFIALDFTAYTPSYTFSSAVGYPGFQVAVRLEEDTERALNIVLLPLQETGEIAFALAIQWRGKTSAFGEAVTVTVEETPSGGALCIPEGIQAIEEEAFRGTGVRMVRIPDSVEEIGAYAFADNPALGPVELARPFLPDETVFDGSPNAVLCIDDAAWGFQSGLPFLVK